MKMTTFTQKAAAAGLKLVCYLATALSAHAGQRLVDSPPPPGMRGWNWPSTPPGDCPFPPSDTIRAVQLSGRHAAHTKADTFYPSWGADGRLYSPFTDGSVNEVKSWSGGDTAVVGHAIIEGDDPLTLKVVAPDVVPGNPAPYGGRYPCGSLHYNGVWYLGTYALANAPYGLNWPIMGPCAGFHTSTDNGRTWSEEQTVDRVWLFDRLNDPDQVTGGLLIFSDGSTEPVGALPDDARQGVEVFFPPKKIKWLIFAVTAVKPSSRNIGLSEIAVFRSKP
jgi:hypothetical protein